MSLTTIARNQALDAIGLDSMSLHSAFPGATGANEISGGGYTRQACTFNASSGGVRTVSAVTNFSVGAGTVRWAGLWGGGVFKGYSPNGGSPKEFQVDPATDVISVPSHGYSDGETVVFYGGVIPTGLVEGTIYYARDVTTNTFKVAATLGGLPVDITAVAAPDCVVSRIVESTYGGADTHTINTWSVGLVF
ncbi:hypothetical protein ABIE51_001465 [Lysobacter sp. OAE881]|uniref:phage tail fiber protein n=1 Tax=Lysobacter sp. OAE881 TaxID=2663813 RepID=UPI0017899E3E